MYIQCNYLRSDQAQQDLTLTYYLFIYLLRHKAAQNTLYEKKI